MARICNMCGKVFDDFDEQEDRSFHDYIGYGSKFDLHRIDLDMCCDCFDKLLEEYILPKAKFNPIKGEEVRFENEVEREKCCEKCDQHTEDNRCEDKLPPDGCRTIVDGDCEVTIYCSNAATCTECCGGCGF